MSVPQNAGAHQRTVSSIGRALTVTALVLLGACAAPRVTGFRVIDHAVTVHADGRALEALPPEEVAERGRPVGRRLDDQTSAEHLSRLMDSVRVSRHDTILIYIHGGRITPAKGYARAEARGPVLDSAGYYPIFINWNSSGTSSLLWHLFRTRQGLDWGPVRGTLSAPLVLAASLGRAIGRAPLGAVHQAADYCRTLGGLGRGDLEGRLAGSRFCPIPGVDASRRAQARYEQRLLSGDSTAQEFTPGLAVGIGTHDLGVPEGTLRVASGIVTAAPKLLSGPLLDALGTGTWIEMRRRAHTTIRSRRELARRVNGEAMYHPPTGVVHGLIDSLVALVAAQGADSVPTSRRRTRTLILAGHSMGTIVIDRILEHFPTLPAARIIYLAPASTVHELEAGVVRFLAFNPSVQYYHGMLHPYADAGEWQPALLDLVPRGSLLEWVDDHLANPDTPLDRVAGKWTNIVGALQIFPPGVRERVIIKAFGVRDAVDADDPARWSALRQHAGFSDVRFAFWTDDVWQLRAHRTPEGIVVRGRAPGGARAAALRAQPSAHAGAQGAAHRSTPR